MITKEKIKQSWEFRSLKFVFRMIAVLFFIAYLFGTFPSAWNWAKMKWVRFDDIAKVTEVAESALAKNNPGEVTEWVTFRHKLEREEIISLLEPYTDRLGAAIFFAYSSWSLEAGNEERAVFWRQFGRYRMHYDALRCGLGDGPKDIQGLLQLFPDKRIQALIEKNPGLVRQSIMQVLDYDARHPARNNPVDTCKLLLKINNLEEDVTVDQREWQGIRHMLRIMTEESLKQMPD